MWHKGALILYWMVQEKGGGLQATAAFPDGTPLAYRIVDPRQFILSASFDL